MSSCPSAYVVHVRRVAMNIPYWIEYSRRYVLNAKGRECRHEGRERSAPLMVSENNPPGQIACQHQHAFVYPLRETGEQSIQRRQSMRHEDASERTHSIEGEEESGCGEREAAGRAREASSQRCPGVHEPLPRAHGAAARARAAVQSLVVCHSLATVHCKVTVPPSAQAARYNWCRKFCVHIPAIIGAQRALQRVPYMY
jgi:hypothetical protein